MDTYIITVFDVYAMFAPIINSVADPNIIVLLLNAILQFMRIGGFVGYIRNYLLILTFFLPLIEQYSTKTRLGVTQLTLKHKIPINTYEIL